MTPKALSKQPPSVSRGEDRNWISTLLGHQVCIRTHGRQTNGQLSIIEFIEKPQSRPPAFSRHAFVEVFSILEGVFRFQCLGHPAVDAVAGTVITVPEWTPHSFWNPSDQPARVLTICSPAGLERFFESSEALISRYKQHTIDHAGFESEMVHLRQTFGIELVAPPPDLKD